MLQRSNTRAVFGPAYQEVQDSQANDMEEDESNEPYDSRNVSLGQKHFTSSYRQVSSWSANLLEGKQR